MRRSTFITVVAAASLILFMAGEALGDDVPAQSCTGQDCLSGTAKSADTCDGQECDPPSPGEASQCDGLDCQPIQQQNPPIPENKPLQPQTQQ